jgi:hypothetical protein
MTDPVNLNKSRKAKKRDEKKVAASANRVKFGRTKAEKRNDASEALGQNRILDGAKREDEV